MQLTGSARAEVLRVDVDHSPDADSVDGQEWDALVAANPWSGFMQSLHWAELRRAMGSQCVQTLVRSGGKLIGGATWYTSPAVLGPGILVAPEGPVLPWDEPELAAATFRALISGVEEMARERGAIALRVEPRLPLPAPRVMRNFGRAPVDLLPIETLTVDLRETEDALLAAMHPKGRYNARLAERRGVTVTQESSAGAARRFHALLDEVGRRDGFFVEPAPFFAAVAETLVPAGMARFLFAEHEDDTLGALLLVTFGARATYLYGGVTGEKRNLMGGYALQWSAIRTAKQLGCREYDFYGFDPSGDPEHAHAGFSRFKRQFGGTPRRFIGAHDLFLLDSLADAVVRAVQEISREAP